MSGKTKRCAIRAGQALRLAAAALRTSPLTLRASKLGMRLVAAEQPA